MAFSILKIPAVVQAAVAQTIIVTAAEPPPTLEELALSAPNPTTLDDLALAVGVRPELLHRVNRGLQALPAQLLTPIAAQLGLQSGEVAGAARAVLSLGTNLGARVLSPLPPDRLLGDPIYPRPVASTVPPVFG